nr:zinc knuckle CX2CX4HX4C [Tanacetum cinerariifolium]
GRSSFARCLIEVNSEADLMDVVTIGIPSLTRDDFTKETICVEYEWRPPIYDECEIFGHVHDQCPKKVVTPIVSTSIVVTPTVEKGNDGFQTMDKKKKRKGKSKSTNGGPFVGHVVKQNVRYEPKANTNAPKKGATNVGNASNSSFMLKSIDDKSPGPDGYTATFFKEAWTIVGDEVANAIREFFTNGKLLKELNHTIIALIPKVKGVFVKAILYLLEGIVISQSHKRRNGRIDAKDC